MSPDLYIILPVFNRSKITMRFIDLLKAQSFQNWFIVLVDDNSKDDTVKLFQASVGDKGHVIHGNGSLWWAGGLQKGYEWLKSQKIKNDSCVYISNDDINFSFDFLENALNYLHKNPNSLVSAIECDLHSKREICSGVKVNWRHFSFEFHERVEPDCFSTRSIFLKAEKFLALGGFYPRLLPHYFSDYEFTARAKKKGLQLKALDELKVYVDSTTTGIHSLNYAVSLKKFLNQCFTKRSVLNPFYKISFTWLTCPTFEGKLRSTRHILKSLFSMLKKYAAYRLNTGDL